MRKKFLLLITMFLGALYVGCSSDDGYLSYELDEDAKLQNTKNLILSYGQKYGLSNIQFNDELLRKNLDLPKEVFEKYVIQMAVEMGNLEPSSKIIRRLRRSSSLGENEPAGQQFYYYVTNSKDLSYASRDFVFRFTIKYMYGTAGINAWDVVDKKAKVYVFEYCENKSCKILHEVYSGYDARCINNSTNAMFMGSIPYEEGAKIHITIPYSINISFSYGKRGFSADVNESFDDYVEVKKSKEMPLL